MKKTKDTSSVIMFNGKPFKVPPGGTLGILALGNIGVRALKQANKEHEEAEKNDKKKA